MGIRIAAGLLLASSLLAQSQLGTGALGGTVQDASGQVVPGAKVIVTSKSTGLIREAETGPAGTFHVPVLPPGNYRAQVSKEGFATLDVPDVLVTVGSTATVIAKLQIGSVTETITVRDEVVIDTAKTDESSLIDRKIIQDLPINGRRADQFALLVPGVTRDGRFGLLSYRGMSGVFNNFMIEGNDDNQAYFSEARGRTRIAGNVSANAVQEFQVGKGAFLAEFGRAAGGSINATIRSGGNDFHADGFYYWRNESLLARDPLASFRPEELRQQFGGSVSGPIRRDKLFFFLNYDQQLRNFPLVTEDTSRVLEVGRPVLPNNPTPAQVAQFEADQRAFNAGTAFLRGRFPNGAPGNSLPRTADQWLGLAKVDWLLDRKNTLSVFYNQLLATGKNAIQTPLVLGNVGRNGTDDVRIWSVNTRLTTTFTPSDVNEFRFQWSRNHEFQFANEAPPQVFVGGFSFGRATFLERPALPDERRLQFVNNYSKVISRHQFKFGGEINRVYDIIDNPALFGGSYTYANALLFGRDLLDPAGRQYTQFQQNFGLPGVNFATIDYALFAQDQWRPFRKLTINYGVRYDYQQLPNPVAPNPAVPETQQINEDRTAIGPRIGIAWDLAGNGKTVVRGGYGLYYGRIPNGLIQNALAQTGLLDVSRSTVALTLRPGDPGAPLYPAILPNLPASAAGSTTVFRIDPEFRRPRIQDVTLGIEREIFSKTVLAASYIYTRGDRLPINFDANLPAPAFQRTYQLPDGSRFTVPFSAGVTRNAAGQALNVNASRPNPAFGAINVVRSIGDTWYNALFVELRRRYANGFQLNFAYTLAKAENISGSGNGGGSGSETPFNGSNVPDQFDLSGNRGIAPTDQRHRLVWNGVWEPGQNLTDPFWRGLIRGFLLSGIYTAESGRPVSSVVAVPNIPFATPDGTQWNGFGGLRGQGGGSDRNLLPTIIRNSNYGEWNYRFDLRLSRSFRLTERFQMEFIGEGFNLFNTSNFNGFNNTSFQAAATTVTTPLSQPIALTADPSFFRENNNGSQPDGTNARRFQLAIRFRY